MPDFAHFTVQAQTTCRWFSGSIFFYLETISQSIFTITFCCTCIALHVLSDMMKLAQMKWGTEFLEPVSIPPNSNLTRLICSIISWFKTFLSHIHINSIRRNCVWLIFVWFAYCLTIQFNFGFLRSLYLGLHIPENWCCVVFSCAQYEIKW